ncbi:MAG: FAD-dependent oxidoreductase, partial [Burkholderiales bacterium]
YQAGALVITPGPWAPEALAALNLPLVVARQVVFWFNPPDGTAPFAVGRFPIYIWEPSGKLPFYGFPALDGADGGVKVAIHGGGAACTPNVVDRAIHMDEVDQMRQYLARYLPTLNGPLLAAQTCMYTNTPDGHFVIAHHPAHRNVAIAAGFSGHGFKFAPVVGEILADLVQDGVTRHPIALFSPDRFAAQTRPR